MNIDVDTICEISQTLHSAPEDKSTISPIAIQFFSLLITTLKILYKKKLNQPERATQENCENY